MSELFEAAKALADELEAQWDQSFSRRATVGEGIPVTLKPAPDPRQHFEVRVRDGDIVVLCRTATANGWHRIRNRTKRPWRGFAVRSEFETREGVGRVG